MELRPHRTWHWATSLILKIPPNYFGLATLALCLCLERSEHKAELGFPLAHPGYRSHLDPRTGTWSSHNLLTAPLGTGWVPPHLTLQGLALVNRSNIRRPEREPRVRETCPPRGPLLPPSVGRTLPSQPVQTGQSLGLNSLSRMSASWVPPSWYFALKITHSAQSVGFGMKGAPRPHTHLTFISIYRFPFPISLSLHCIWWVKPGN